MSMLVGAYKPRQKTAFASEELKVMVAAKDARAALSSNNTRMAFPQLSNTSRSHLDWTENATQGPAAVARSFSTLTGGPTKCLLGSS
jgi:hypothetical protein